VKLVKNKKIVKRIIIGVCTSLFIALVLMYRYHIYYYILKLKTPKVEIENDEKFKFIHPVFKYNLYKFLKTLEQRNYKIIATSGYRSFEKQNELYNSGLSTAKAGYSLHNYGLAVDINLVTPEGNSLVMNSSKNNWLVAVSEYEKYGLRWGGNFNDNVHFDYKNKYPDIEYLKMLYDNNDLVNKKFIKI
jgi:peptidoglycan LD-endopeptidase CwlK